MARRSSGHVNIDIKYIDSRDQYRAVVSICRGRREVVYVGPPKALKIPVDSPKAYDAAARAAISFADKIDALAHAQYDRSGSDIEISRRSASCNVRRR